MLSVYRLLKRQGKVRQELGIKLSRQRAIRWCLASLGNSKIASIACPLPMSLHPRLWAGRRKGGRRVRYIDRLKKEAREAAERQGLDLGRFEASWKRHHFTAICRRCSNYVCVTPKPLPNEIDIGGPAVALDCNG